MFIIFTRQTARFQRCQIQKRNMWMHDRYEQLLSEKCLSWQTFRQVLTKTIVADFYFQFETVQFQLYTLYLIKKEAEQFNLTVQAAKSHYEIEHMKSWLFWGTVTVHVGYCIVMNVCWLIKRLLSRKFRGFCDDINVNVGNLNISCKQLTVNCWRALRKWLRVHCRLPLTKYNRMNTIAVRAIR